MSRLTVLLPATSHRAIEERYATWQTELLLTRASGASPVHYDPSAATEVALSNLAAEYALIVTTPLIVPVIREGIEQLVAALDQFPDAVAAVPTTHDARNPQQHRVPAEPYLTLRQFEDAAKEIAGASAAPRVQRWTGGDPGMFLARVRSLRSFDSPPASALQNREVAVVPRAFFHRYAEQRGQTRLDMLEHIGREARSVLEFGCGEGGLGAALKERQGCRVVGIELDPQAATIARSRLDAVHCGDVRRLIESIDEEFDWIVGGDILEHLDEPWTFLSELRKLARPGGHLLLSLPNISSWPVVADLLRGRFDYVYLGILCAGHLRFFTRSSVRDVLDVAGWETVALRDQEHFVTPEYEQLKAALESGGVPHSPEDLLAPGHYVIARRPNG